MAKLGHIEIYVLLIQLICLLGVSKFFGELARRFKQPAVIGEIMLGKADSPPSPPASSIIVLPGGRANLVAYKLRHDPRLRALCAGTESSSFSNASIQGAAAGWRFLKFRHLRQMLDNLLLQRNNLDEILAQDGLTYTAPQMRLF